MTAERQAPTSGIEDFNRHLAKKIAREMAIVNKITEIEDPNNYLQQVAERIENGAYPIFYANHTHHANIGGFMEVAKRLGKKRPKKLIIPIARSLLFYNEGKINQDRDVIDSANALAPELAKLGMVYVTIIRQKDVSMLLGVDGSNTAITREMLRNAPSEVKEIIEQGNRDKNAIIDSLDIDAGCMVFPEGTTTGGIKKDDGKRTGMIEVDINLFNEFIDWAMRKERDIVCIPISMNGYNYIVEPRTKKYSRTRAALWYARNTVTDFLHINVKGFGEKPAKVTINKPFGIKEITEDGLIEVNDKGNVRAIKDFRKVNQYFMTKVSAGLEPELQGVYPVAA